jgi:two-component system response regulator WspF
MRIAIAHSSAASVTTLTAIVTSNPKYRVVWVASTGTEAVEKSARDRPDLLLMDLSLPGKDGVQATRAIMKEHPCAILIVTEAVSRNAARVFEAMGAGALDAESTPVADERGNIRGAEVLLRKIATIERLISGEYNGKGREGQRAGAAAKGPMIAIGSSTGGPKALSEVVSRLPQKPGAPIVIVQHVDAQFASGLVDWLSSQTKLRVVLAQAGRSPEPNVVFVAGTNDHLVLADDMTFRYVPEPRDNPYRPSVDVFFRSLADAWIGKGVAVLLTGMGRDGANGLLALRKAGWHTIAQDKATSVVYGMPRAAAEMNAASEVLPIEKIAAAIAGRIPSKEGRSL